MPWPNLAPSLVEPLFPSHYHNAVIKTQEVFLASVDLLLGLMPTRRAQFLMQVPSALPAWWYCCKSQSGLEEQGIHPILPRAKE